MIKHAAVFVAGLGVAFLIGVGFRRPRAQQVFRRVRRSELDLNACSIEQLTQLGVDEVLANRIIESRPYRNKLELVSRVMLPNATYSSIKDRIRVGGTRQPVKVAS